MGNHSADSPSTPSRRRSHQSPSRLREGGVDQHFWCRTFSRCRTFLFGLILGGFIAQTFTSALSLCMTHDMAGLDFPTSRSKLRSGRRPSRSRGDDPKNSNRTPLHPPSSLDSRLSFSPPHNVEMVPIETQIGNYSHVRDFEKQPGVVIATKIHGPAVISQLKQSMCLLKAAYNDRLNYDVLIFTTLPLADYDMHQLQEIVHPASLRIETEKQTLTDQLKGMTRMQKMLLKRRCGVNSTDDLFWFTRCCEDGMTGSCMPLAYTWQSEFRAKHLWHHSAIKPYKYMMWFDSDAMATRVWHHDPVAVAIRNQLKILFSHFPQGKSSGTDLRDKIIEAYNETLCILKIKEGHLFAKGGTCLKPVIPNIHGFFHVTDLDFYRSTENLRWYDILIGDTKFSRRWDDQLAVTVPAAMRAPQLSWEMEAIGVKNDVWHNQMFDGKYRWRGGGYQAWWKINGTNNFPEGAAMCEGLITNGG